MYQRLLAHMLGMVVIAAPLTTRADLIAPGTTENGTNSGEIGETTPSRGESSRTGELAVEHVLVTVPIHKKEAETALPVTVLTGEALRESAVASIGETLNGKPGLASASFGPGVGQPVIRGQQGPRVKVLQNGTGSMDASRVSADHAVSVEPLLADSIEVLRGPATLLYGGGAIGGVVNVIDSRIPARAVTETRGGLELRHATGADEDTVVFRAETATGPLNWHVSGVYRDWGLMEIPGAARREAPSEHDQHDHGHSHSHDHEASPDGYLENSDGRAHQVNLGTSWVFERGYLGIALSQLENRYGIPPGGHGHHDEHDHGQIRLEVEQDRLDLAGEYRPGGVVEALRTRLTYTDYQHREIEGNGGLGTVYSNEAWEGRFEAVHGRLAGWHGVAGIQLQHSNFSAVGEESFIPRSDVGGMGLFVVEDFHRGDWTYELGLRVDRDQVDPEGRPTASFTSLSGSASALWDIDASWSLGLAVSRSERAPVTEELFSNAGNAAADLVVHGATQAVEIGDPDLDTEVARNVDLSLRWRRGGWDVSTVVFYNDSVDFIHLANSGAVLNPGTDEELPILHYRQEDASFRGLEYEITAPAWNTGWGELTVSVYGDVVRGELDRSGDVPRMPPRRMGLRAELETGPVRAFIDLLDAADQDRAGMHESATDGYTRLDMGVSYRTALWGTAADLFLRGNNLTDEDIRSSTSQLREFAPEAGRSLVAGVRLAF